MNISALNYSPLPKKLQLIELLQKIMDNDELSTCHDNVIITSDKFIHVSQITGQIILSKVEDIITRDSGHPVGTVYNELYTFKHPTILECTQPGRCGFIVRRSKLDDKSWISELSTNTEDYTGTGLHLHDIISASDMFPYVINSGNTAPDNKVKVGGRLRWWDDWLPDVTDWKWEQICGPYNISDYLVTKQD